jgi:hypothetical protein
MITIPRIALGLAALVAVGLSGCGPAQLAKGDVEEAAQQALTASAGQESPPVTCPSDMKAEVGATQVCSITLNDKPYDVTVTVIEYANGQAKFSAEVASEPRAE